MEPLSFLIGLCVTQFCWIFADSLDTYRRRIREYHDIMDELKILRNQVGRLETNK